MRQIEPWLNSVVAVVFVPLLQYVPHLTREMSTAWPQCIQFYLVLSFCITKMSKKLCVEENYEVVECIVHLVGELKTVGTQHTSVYVLRAFFYHPVFKEKLYLEGFFKWSCTSLL